MCFFWLCYIVFLFFFFFQAEDGIRDVGVTGVQTCALPISRLLIGGVVLVDLPRAPVLGVQVSRRPEKLIGQDRSRGHVVAERALEIGNDTSREGRRGQIGRASCRERV